MPPSVSQLARRIPAELPLTTWRLLGFGRRVVSRFLANKGLLLAGSIAYNTLLSIIPLFAIFLVALSHVFDTETVLEVIRYELDVIAPGHAARLAEDISLMLERRTVVEGVGLLVLLFLSSLSFRIIEDALSIIFYGQLPGRRASHLTDVFKRKFWVSAVIPYVYVLVMGVVLMGGTVLLSFLQAFSGKRFRLFGFEGQLDDIWGWGLWLIALAAQILLLASLYKVMPHIRVSSRRALTGGLAAGLLWEVTRHGLAWYFKKVSLVGRVYGSLTTVIVILLTMEVAAIILLLGAQVIAELRLSELAGKPWWVTPVDSDDEARRLESAAAKDEAAASGRLKSPASDAR